MFDMQRAMPRYRMDSVTSERNNENTRVAYNSTTFNLDARMLIGSLLLYDSTVSLSYAPTSVIHNNMTDVGALRSPSVALMDLFLHFGARNGAKRGNCAYVDNITLVSGRALISMFLQAKYPIR